VADVSECTVVDPELDTVIGCFEDTVVVVAGIVADVSADTAVIQRWIL
jgi:hypothetical protein